MALLLRTEIEELDGEPSTQPTTPMLTFWLTYLSIVMFITVGLIPAANK
jgi:hypothetical protein